jgi:tricorn protease
MKPWFSLALTLAVSQTSLGVAREAKLVRYPHFHQGKVTFTYLSDIWTANEDGSNPQRITVNKARDYRSKFSPDGKWIAFSSERQCRRLRHAGGRWLSPGTHDAFRR